MPDYNTELQMELRKELFVTTTLTNLYTILEEVGVNFSVLEAFFVRHVSLEIYCISIILGKNLTENLSAIKNAKIKLNRIKNLTFEERLAIKIPSKLMEFEEAKALLDEYGIESESAYYGNDSFYLTLTDTCETLPLITNADNQ